MSEIKRDGLDQQIIASLAEPRDRDSLLADLNDKNVAVAGLVDLGREVNRRVAFLTDSGEIAWNADNTRQALSPNPRQLLLWPESVYMNLHRLRTPRAITPVVEARPRHNQPAMGTRRGS